MACTLAFYAVDCFLSSIIKSAYAVAYCPCLALKLHIHVSGAPDCLYTSVVSNEVEVSYLLECGAVLGE